MVRICLIIISRFNLLVGVINDGVFKATGQGGCGTRVGARSRSPPPPKKKKYNFFLNFITFNLLWGGGGFLLLLLHVRGLFRAGVQGRGGIKYFSYVIKYREGDGDFPSRLCHTSRCTGVVCVLILAYMYIATRTQVHICNN